jgi:DNA-binding NtrC family response regulator
MTGVTSNVEDRLANRTVLVADDSEAVRTAFQVLLSLHGARVLGASSPAEALATVRSQEVDLVIQDMNFRREATSGEEGIALFKELRSLHPDVPVILLRPGRTWKPPLTWSRPGRPITSPSPGTMRGC